MVPTGSEPKEGLSVAMKNLEIEELDLHRVNRMRRRRNILHLVIGCLASILSFALGYVLGERAASYPYSVAMVATSVPLNRSNIDRGANSKPGVRALIAIGIASAVLISGFVGWLVGQEAGDDWLGTGIEYGVYSGMGPKS